MVKEQKNIVIDSYLREIAPHATGMTEVVKVVSDTIGVAVSTIHRWRAADCIPRADEVVSIVIAVNRNRPNERKCTLKDVAILCNYKDNYRKKSGE